MKAKNPHKKRKRRLGQGNGSGSGKTSGRGHKGQRARSGYSFRPGFEGGQNPLYRRLPKRGFNHDRFRIDVAAVNLNRLVELGAKDVNPAILIENGLMKKSDKVLKILGTGELKGALTVNAHRFSASAKEKIEKAGGKAIVIEAKPKADKK